MKIATPPPMRGFWWFNAVAWSLYAGLSMFMAATFAAFSSAMVLICVVLGGALFAVSGGIRALALRHAWWERGGVGLVLRLLLAIVLGASLAQLCVWLVLVPALRLGWVSMPSGVFP